MSGKNKATAFAPASVGNVAVGFDMLGMALADIGDRVTVSRSTRPGVQIVDIQAEPGIDASRIPMDWHKNTAAIAADALWREAGDGAGLSLAIVKGIPLKSGMGGSAASAVAGAVAANQLLAKPLSRAELLEFALIGEQVASKSRHADNVAPSLFGGLVFCPTALLPATLSIAMPDSLRCVLIHPDLEISTSESRRGLAATVDMELWLQQQALAMGFVLGCLQGDVDMIGRNLRDVIIEPQRAASIPCFAAVKSAALETGALGCSISGSGPAMFALVVADRAHDVEQSMRQACESSGFTCRSWLSPVNAAGAIIEAA